MKGLLSYFSIFIICFLLLGCQTSTNQDRDETTITENNNEGEDNNMNEVDIFQFENIDKAPEATEKPPVNEVIKIFFSEWTFDAPYEPIAINIESNEVYVNPSLSLHRISTYDDTVSISDAEEILEILERHEVQSWERDYTFEDPDSYQDGYSWRLWLQFEDGTVEKHSGEGTDVEKLTPNNFREFVNELESFVEEKLQDEEN